MWDIVRDINKMSNNVMARQLFLTLATARAPPPATTARATETVLAWLARRKLRMPELVLDNGSGLSRRERISAGSLARLLVAADGSAVREEFASSLAVAAMDGTVQRRFVNGSVAGQALLKTGTLDGVRALAGYVIDNDGRRFAVVAIVNHANAAARRARSTTSCSGSTANGATWRPAALTRDEGAAARGGRAGSSAGYRLALLEQQVAADHAVDHPDRGHRPDRDRDRHADQDDAENAAARCRRSRPRGTSTRTSG